MYIIWFQAYKENPIFAYNGVSVFFFFNMDFLQYRNLIFFIKLIQNNGNISSFLNDMAITTTIMFDICILYV